MTYYLLSVYGSETDEMPPQDVITQMYADVDVVNKELQAAGVWVFAGGLHPANTATVVAEKNGEIVMTDGPYPEAKEQLGGFWIIKVDDLDAALEWARKATVACRGPVEVRPFQPDTDEL